MFLFVWATVLASSFLTGAVAWAASGDATLATSFFVGTGADKDNCEVAVEWKGIAAEIRGCPPPLSELPALDQRQRRFDLTLNLDRGVSCPLAAATVLISKNSHYAAVTPGVACVSMGGGTPISAAWGFAARGATASVFTGSAASSIRR